MGETPSLALKKRLMMLSGSGCPIAKEIDEGLHQTENRLASTIPMWQLDCLPDEAAARLCHDTITNIK